MSFIESGILIDYAAAPTLVSTLTELLPFYSTNAAIMEHVEVTLENQSVLNKAVLQVDVSEGALPNLDAQQKAVVAPQSEGRVLFSGVIPSQIRVTAYGDPDQSYPPVNVRFKVRAKRAVQRM